jgi:hypothetical protein
MQAAIDRVMQTFMMMASLTREEAEAVRERLTAHLAGMEADEKALAVEGLPICAAPIVFPSDGSQGRSDDG